MVWYGQPILYVQSETMVHRGDELSRIHGPLGRLSADGVTAPDDLATADATSRQADRPAARPVIASAAWINARRSPEFRNAAHQRFRQQITCGEILDQGGVSLIVCRGGSLLHFCDGTEGMCTMHVP